ncbi:HXXEE domain-containing protein [Roseibium algae]|uniref:HXXEE domain-containing protein n=1 Tax=Roseibium algae TaxID=3123038 RepID=A0ABU8TL37_9HYPH
MVINVIGVWALIFAVIWLTFWLNSGLALIGSYLLLVNAVSHVGAVGILRSYNPGLATAVLLFIPYGVWSLMALDGMIRVAGDNAIAYHALGLSAAVLLHATMIIHVRHRAKLNAYC